MNEPRVSYTALHNACWFNHLKVIEILAAFGANIDAVDNFDVSALMHAADRSSLDSIRLLLALNADMTNDDEFGRTALQRTDNTDVKQLLLEHEKKSVIVCELDFQLFLFRHFVIRLNSDSRTTRVARTNIATNQI